MDLSQYQSYFIPVALVLFLSWRFWSMKQAKAKIPDYLNRGAVIVDVRGNGEYAQGSKPGSINIPLAELNSRLKELDKNKPIILCCASGTRSGIAVSVLKNHGFKDVINAGSWTNTI